MALSPRSYMVDSLEYSSLMSVQSRRKAVERLVTQRSIDQRRQAASRNPDDYTALVLSPSIGTNRRRSSAGAASTRSHRGSVNRALPYVAAQSDPTARRDSSGGGSVTHGTPLVVCEVDDSAVAASVSASDVSVPRVSPRRRSSVTFRGVATACPVTTPEQPPRKTSVTPPTIKSCLVVTATANRPSGGAAAVTTVTTGRAGVGGDSRKGAVDVLGTLDQRMRSVATAPNLTDAPQECRPTAPRALRYNTSSTADSDSETDSEAAEAVSGGGNSSQFIIGRGVGGHGKDESRACAASGSAVAAVPTLCVERRGSAQARPLDDDVPPAPELFPQTEEDMNAVRGGVVVVVSVVVRWGGG